MPTTNFAIKACYNLDDHEAHNDELKGTLLEHIDYVDEALDRQEGNATEADCGKKIEGYYVARGHRDDRRNDRVNEKLVQNWGISEEAL